MMKIKICGMRDIKNIEAVAALRPHYMGFIFYKLSPRYVGDNFELKISLPEDIIKVGVWVNAEPDEILAIAERNVFNAIQLHGNESPADCEVLRKKGYQLIKAFAVDEYIDFNLTDHYADVCDYFLFDTKGKQPGGNAEKFNWGLLNKYKGNTPYFLSGGLSLHNFGNALALRDKRLYALDFNSGIEQSPGYKDLSKVCQLMQNLPQNLKTSKH